MGPPPRFSNVFGVRETEINPKASTTCDPPTKVVAEETALRTQGRARHGVRKRTQIGVLLGYRQGRQLCLKSCCSALLILLCVYLTTFLFAGFPCLLHKQAQPSQAGVWQLSGSMHRQGCLEGTWFASFVTWVYLHLFCSRSSEPAFVYAFLTSRFSISNSQSCWSSSPQFCSTSPALSVF